MLGGCFEEYIVSRFGSYDVASNGHKYIHCDLTYEVGFFIMTLNVG
jgi:hypothetical protein